MLLHDKEWRSQCFWQPRPLKFLHGLKSALSHLVHFSFVKFIVSEVLICTYISFWCHCRGTLIEECLFFINVGIYVCFTINYVGSFKWNRNLCLTFFIFHDFLYFSPLQNEAKCCYTNFVPEWMPVSISVAHFNWYGTHHSIFQKHQFSWISLLTFLKMNYSLGNWTKIHPRRILVHIKVEKARYVVLRLLLFEL